MDTLKQFRGGVQVARTNAAYAPGYRHRAVLVCREEHEKLKEGIEGYGSAKGR